MEKLYIWSHGGARGKIRGSLKSAGVILWAPWISVQSFITIFSVVVEIFQFGPSGGLNNISIPKAAPLEWLTCIDFLFVMKWNILKMKENQEKQYKIEVKF